MKSNTKDPLNNKQMSLKIAWKKKYLGYRFSSVKISASCLWIWFAGIHLWIQQTKHLQCGEQAKKMDILKYNWISRSKEPEPLFRSCEYIHCFVEMPFIVVLWPETLETIESGPLCITALFQNKSVAYFQPIFISLGIFNMLLSFILCNFLVRMLKYL